MKSSKIVATLLITSTMAFSFSLDSITKTVLDTVKKPEQNSSSTSVGSLSSSTINQGLKEALSQGVKIAVDTLGKDNGYLNNSLVKIPLPENLQKVETIIRKAGGGNYADELITAMNDAASQAAPQTAGIFMEAIEKMSIEDATKILNGSNTDATKYFKENTYTQLKELITPIVKKSISRNQVASYYESFNSFYQSQGKGLLQSSGVMGYAKTLGVDSYLPGGDDKNLDEYITTKAINGLFTMIEKEEIAIRENPVNRTTSLLKQVFGQ